MIEISLEAKERFRSHYKVNEKTGCWEFDTLNERGGYGRFYFNKKGHAAHRFSWIMYHGKIPRLDDYYETCVCHRCDNPSCVNPDHLFLGTTVKNQKDKIEKGRHNPAPLSGEKHPCSKLTEDKVVEIFLSKVGQKTIAKQYGVASGTVQRIRQSKAWKHVTEGLSRPY